MSVTIVRLKEGPCPRGAMCVAIGSIIMREDVLVPEGDYLVVMSPIVAQAINLGEIKRKFKCVICVGPSTAAAVGDCVIPREYSSYGVARLIRELAPGKVVVLRSNRGNDVLRSLLPDVVEVPVYEIRIDRFKLTKAVEAVQRSQAVVLTSSMVAEEIARNADLRGKVVVAIGPVTSSKLAQLGIPHLTAPEATMESAYRTALEELERFKR